MRARMHARVGAAPRAVPRVAQSAALRLQVGLRCARPPSLESWKVARCAAFREPSRRLRCARPSGVIGRKVALRAAFRGPYTFKRLRCARPRGPALRAGPRKVSEDSSKLRSARLRVRRNGSRRRRWVDASSTWWIFSHINFQNYEFSNGVLEIARLLKIHNSKIFFKLHIFRWDGFGQFEIFRSFENIYFENSGCK